MNHNVTDMFTLVVWNVTKVLVHITFTYPPASKANREEANLTERKNPHTPVYGVKEFVHLSVCDIIQTS